MACRNSGTLVHLELSTFGTDLLLPPDTKILRRTEPPALAAPDEAIGAALSHPMGTAPLAELYLNRLGQNGSLRLPQRLGKQRLGKVVIVLSDHTRPVPYRGPGNILWPVVSELMRAGCPGSDILLLVATGTHRVLGEEEIWAMVDPRVRECGAKAACHDASKWDDAIWVGRTKRGTDVFIDRRYVEADFRILTGLVEPHSMAGASGGRKSICPGLVDLRTIREFHGAEVVSHPLTTDLVLEGNPCHELALEVARMAPPDFIVNVTLRRDGALAGIFAGEMEQAHQAAVEHLRRFATIPVEDEFDVVVTHGGQVGVNFYQAEKATAIAARAVRTGGYIVMVADTLDPDPLGPPTYRQLLGLLAEVGPQKFVERLLSPEWEFREGQWAVHMRAKFLGKIPKEHLYYFSPQATIAEYELLSAVPWPFLTETEGLGAGERAARFVARAVEHACKTTEVQMGRAAKVAFLADGPYGVVVPN